jgi:hypothetical protein
MTSGTVTLNSIGPPGRNQDGERLAERFHRLLPKESILLWGATEVR